MTAAIAATGCEVLRLRTAVGMDGLSWSGRKRAAYASRQSSTTNGAPIVLGGGAALKGCAARTPKRASALDRVPAAERWAMMPLWLNG